MIGCCMKISDWLLQEQRKKERQAEEKRMAEKRAEEEARRKAEEVKLSMFNILIIN